MTLCVTCAQLPVSALFAVIHALRSVTNSAVSRCSAPLVSDHVSLFQSKVMVPISSPFSPIMSKSLALTQPHSAAFLIFHATY